MKREQWQCVFDTYQQVRTLLDEYLPAQVVTPPGKQAPAPRQDPQELLLELKKLLQAAVRSLELGMLGKDPGLGADELEQVLRPFVYLVDELVQFRLAETNRREEWPMLQFERFGEDSGGDLFFELATERLNNPDDSTLIYEMLHFCLTAGFKGRYAEKPAKLREYKQRLAARIPQPERATAPPVPVTTGEAQLPEIPYRYYMATGFFVLAVPVVLWWSSR